MKNFYIADLHFGHEMIIDFDGRPFASAGEMDAELTHRWNAAVGPGDTVYILGDFCWKGERDWLRVLAELRGEKVLIRGNHDIEPMSDTLIAQFSDVRDVLTVKDGPYEVLLSHYPLMFFAHDMDPDTVMLCGHVHLTRENDYLNAWRAQLRENRTAKRGNCGNIINVGCMLPYMDYTPRTLSEILAAVPLWAQD